jgi:hypothetical protein
MNRLVAGYWLLEARRWLMVEGKNTVDCWYNSMIILWNAKMGSRAQ